LGSPGCSWSSSGIAPLNSNSVTPSIIRIAWMHNKSHGCIIECNMLGMKCTTAILVLYSNHFTKVHISSPVEKYLPNLHNLLYNCSSSVKGLTPNNQQE
jgi:hypothetical protein